MSSKTFNGKVLLFGEYTIIFGAQALAIPVAKFGGQWAYKGIDNKTEKATAGLKGFGQFLDGLQMDGTLLSDLDTTSFLNELSKGLYFNSTIPQGYGIGSSGALCAAVYDRFSKKKIKEAHSKALELLQTQLSQIEQYFHGSSSGIDPLVSYLNQAVLVQDQQSRVVQLPVSNTKKAILFLLNSGIPRKTAPLVDLFLEKCKDDKYSKQCQEVLGPLNEVAVHAFLNKKSNTFLAAFTAISRFQFQHFKEMIPDSFQEIWKMGLEDDLFKLKLCGAGGGGFILGFTRDFEQFKKQITDYELLPFLKL